jgi:hypothetical protein
MSTRSTTVSVGFAADAAGNGVAYIRWCATGAGRVLRVPFSVKRFPALLEREVGYGALAAACTALRRRGVERLRLCIDDERLVNDLREHRDVPAALTLAYVRLRCALNQFVLYEIDQAPASESDLTARSRSEVCRAIAA